MVDIDSWIREITDSTIALHQKLHLLDMFTEIVDSSSNLQEGDLTFVNQAHRSMVADIVISIGRLCDQSSDSQSVVQLIHQLKNKRSELLRRERYLERYDDDNRHLADRDFDELAGEGKSQYPQRKLDELEDMLTVQQPIKKVIDFRHEYIAHYDQDQGEKPSYDQLRGCFGVIGDVVDELSRLLTGKAHITFVPQVSLEWLDIFTKPWIDDQNRD